MRKKAWKNIYLVKHLKIHIRDINYQNVREYDLVLTIMRDTW